MRKQRPGWGEKEVMRSPGGGGMGAMPDRTSGRTRKDRGLVTKTPGRRSWVYCGPGAAYLPWAPLGQSRDPCIPPWRCLPPVAL
jgi:hypothetical protein